MEEGIKVKEFLYDDLQTLSQDRWGLSETTIRLPNDRTSIGTLSGPCRTYRLGRPMKLAELEAMPRDLQLAYLRRLRHRGGTQDAVGEMLGVPPARLNRWGVRFDRPNPTTWAAFLGQC